ncbi:cilia- and flagella-associated protein 57-like isoform X5 [Scomber scombrus]|uniref:cilia- and flagella-associated protein 57-like isoform X5 n=1 Tax=Scomber scombrus TaxID=13677 RepID=UPI002DDABADC|nr:cilia- and flagella-associated protein 57-like isoform X5 [Scomber scombrus]
MRRAAAFLALLLCLYWTRAQGESGGATGNDITQTEIQSEILGVKSTSDQTNISPDIWAELKELRDMAIEHSVELRNSKSKMEKLEQENTAIQARLTASEYKNAVLEARMNASENEVVKLKIESADMMARLKISEHVMEELKRENTDLLHRVTSVEDKNKVLEARMNASENEVEELKRQNADMMARLKISEHVMEELKRENTDLLHRVTSVEDKNKVLEARMNTSENEVEELKIESADMMARLKISENEVEELKRQNADQPKVAFSIGLTDSGLIGPFNTDITLKFSKVITNIGQAYSPSTGLFTAPVRGAYYFSFTTLDRRSSAYRNIYIYHNDKRMLLSYNYSANANESVSNSLVLQLEKGDVVYLVLPAGYSVYDDSGDITTFNGFLLFPL